MKRKQIDEHIELLTKECAKLYELIDKQRKTIHTLQKEYDILHSEALAHEMNAAVLEFKLALIENKKVIDEGELGGFDFTQFGYALKSFTLEGEEHFRLIKINKNIPEVGI